MSAPARDYQAEFEALRSRIAYAAYLGMELIVAGEQLRFRLPFRPDLIGDPSLPAIHGGVIAGFMEASAQMQMLLLLSERRLPKNIDFSLDYLRSGNAADCHADCAVTRQGRRVAQVQVRVWQYERGDPSRTRDIALGRTHFLLAVESTVAEASR
jgi:uncharacterized protein (TIGR00369 family)